MTTKKVLAILTMAVVLGLSASPLSSQEFMAEMQASILDACLQYSNSFEEASTNFHIPSDMLRAIAIQESHCDQNAQNPNDGGCGIMQLTGETRKNVANVYGVSEDALCANNPDGARLNILGGAYVLDSYKCWANPRVYNQETLNKCANNEGNLAFTDGEKQMLSQTLEAWWWPTAAYNGGGLDTYISTSNYPYRVWDKFKILSRSIDYPPLSEVGYFLNGQTTPSGATVVYDSDEFQEGDDDLYPKPSDLGKTGITGGIRWTSAAYNVLSDVQPSVCQIYNSSNVPVPSGFGAWYDVFSPNDNLLKVSCNPSSTIFAVGKGSTSQIIYEKGWKWVAAENRWQQINFSGPIRVTDSQGKTYPWFLGAAHVFIESSIIDTGKNYVVAYVCTSKDLEWKCGCRDNTCNPDASPRSGELWQLQAFQK